MSKPQFRYKFDYTDKCNMCGTSVEHHKILGKRLNQSQGKNPRKKTGITTTICKCNVCGLVYANPLPIPFDLNDHYGVPPEDYWVPEYFKIDDNTFKNDIEQIKELVDFKPGMKSLDIGAGLGTMMIALSNQGFDSYGFEPSLPFYERATTQMGVSKDKIKLGMIEDVDYPENYFDFVYFGAVLEHLYNPSESIEKALKWLKPNGIILIQVPSSDWFINKLINLFYKLRRTDYVGNISPMHEPYHLYEFSLNSFKQHAKKHNYEIALHRYYVCETFMPKWADGFLKRYMKWTNKGMEIGVWLRKK